MHSKIPETACHVVSPQRHAESLRKLRITTDEVEQATALAEEIWKTPWDCSWQAAWDAFRVGAGEAAWLAAEGIAEDIVGDVCHEVGIAVDCTGTPHNPTRVSRRMVHRLQDSATDLLERIGLPKAMEARSVERVVCDQSRHTKDRSR